MMTQQDFSNTEYPSSDGWRSLDDYSDWNQEDASQPEQAPAGTPARFTLVEDNDPIYLDVDPAFMAGMMFWDLCEWLGAHETSCWRVLFAILLVQAVFVQLNSL